MFDSLHWQNMLYSAKDAGGVWHDNACNGHFNNRGFSTISDSPMQWSGCSFVFTGSPMYLASYHTFGNSVNAPFDVYVR